MITIRDLFLAPYEIDVDNKNFTVVEVTISKGGIVAGKETEAGKRHRKVVGYYNTLSGAIGRVMEERILAFVPDIEDQIVNLKQFIAKQEHYRKQFLSLAKHLSFTLPEDLPVVSPKDFLKNQGQQVGEEEIEE